MKSKSIFLMAVSLGFGLVAAIGITQVMGRNNQPAPTKEEPKLPVLVAVSDIDINDELIEDMFSEEEWPARLVPDGIATSFEDLDGMVTTARIGKKGTVLLSNLLEKSKLREKKIPLGFKVIGIKLGAEDHLYGLLEAGDLVDIMAIFGGKNRNSGSGSTSRTFLRRVTVWSIGSKTKKDIEQSANAKGSTVVGLLVTEKQAERIILAERIAELKLAMRGKEDADPSKMSHGTGAGDILDETLGTADAALTQMLQQFGGGSKPPAQSAPLYEPDTFEMVVFTGEGPTKYTFDKNAGAVPTRSEGYGGEGLEVEEDLSVDFEDEDVDIDSNSLIEELDSEPGS